MLEQIDCQVTVPEQQTCCGQPAFNSGDDSGTRKIAKSIITAFEGFDYVVIPSGSCGSMIKVHFPELFADDKQWLERAENLSSRTYELLSFLVDVCDYQPQNISLDASYTYHHSCSGLRELNIFKQPKSLLDKVEGLDLVSMENSTECCGFGGTFCVKYSDISNQIVSEKVGNIVKTDADLLLGGDWGCLMNMSGKLNREGHKNIVALHTAEVLAGMTEELLPETND